MTSPTPLNPRTGRSRGVVGTRWRAWLGVAGLAISLAGCRTYGPQFDARQSGDQSPDVTDLNQGLFATVTPEEEISADLLRKPTEYFRLGPGDTLDVEMLGEAGSRTTVNVGPDGKIYYSLLPGTFVWGLTVPETRELLRRELAQYMRGEVDVAVTPTTVRSQPLWILGEVARPGVYGMNGPMTVLEAITLAGGPSRPEESVIDQSQLRRNESVSDLRGRQSLVELENRQSLSDLGNSFIIRKGKVLRINFRRLVRQGDMTQNIYLQPDDFIYLQSAEGRSIHIMGAVAQPNVVPYSPGLSLVSAIVAAGGTIKYAHLDKVTILRGSLSNPRVAFVDFKAIIKGQAPDVHLQPGDLVNVPYQPYRKVIQFVDEIFHNFVTTVAINEGQRAVVRNALPVGTVITPAIVFPGGPTSP